MAKPSTEPRTYFLNEQHELARGEVQGGGRPAKYAGIDWFARGQSIQTSLRQAQQAIASSKDPLRDRRYFVLVLPEPEVTKESTDKRKAPDGQYTEPTRYAGAHSRVFRRLGLDLLEVTAGGEALVHTTPDRFERLLKTAAGLARAGKAEQARWTTLQSFAIAPESLRVDEEWLGQLAVRKPTEVIIELQPLLSTLEVEEVMRAIARRFDRAAAEALTGSGTDFSGRCWFRGRAHTGAIRALAADFYSIQSLHPPLLVDLQARRVPGPRGSAALVSEIRPSDADIQRLPVVAVVDVGVPPGHIHLQRYQRGQYIDPDSDGVLFHHGSLVAGRVVFGEIDCSSGAFSPPPGTCRFLDVVVSRSPEKIGSERIAIEPKAVLRSMDAVIGNYPDVRVFNLSFGSDKPFSNMSPNERHEHLVELRDLDNFVFFRDAVVVVAAGNTPLGVIPRTPYPRHQDDPSWGLGAWSMGFNTLTCGSTVATVGAGGLARNVDWPSPFTRVGPGLCQAPIPEYAAHGGDCSPSYTFAPQLGVWSCRADGVWEDHPGTSFAAPLLAREVAWALTHLQAVCPTGARPFGVTAKAFLALTARRPNLHDPLEPLADRTIGRGYASAERLVQPQTRSAVLVWQGILESAQDVARVQLPVPRTWLEHASEPHLRIVWAWDPPVHDAVFEIWACRKVKLAVRPPGAERALTRDRGAGNGTYPLVDANFDLRRLKSAPDDDLWLVELSYEEIAEYYPGIEFSPQQRVAFVAELFDKGESRVSPQEALQRLPAAATMVRLSVPAGRQTLPVIIRTRS